MAKVQKLREPREIRNEIRNYLDVNPGKLSERIKDNKHLALQKELDQSQSNEVYQKQICFVRAFNLATITQNGNAQALHDIFKEIGDKPILTNDYSIRKQYENLFQPYNKIVEKEDKDFKYKIYTRISSTSYSITLRIDVTVWNEYTTQTHITEHYITRMNDKKVVVNFDPTPKPLMNLKEELKKCKNYVEQFNKVKTAKAQCNSFFAEKFCDLYGRQI